MHSNIPKIIIFIIYILHSYIWLWNSWFIRTVTRKLTFLYSKSWSHFYGSVTSESDFFQVVYLQTNVVFCNSGTCPGMFYQFFARFVSQIEFGKLLISWFSSILLICMVTSCLRSQTERYHSFGVKNIIFNLNKWRFTYNTNSILRFIQN